MKVRSPFPNIGECRGRGTATFQILGDTCTRACRYCYVVSGKPESPPDPLEPLRLVNVASQMELKHVVVTSVDRDDVADRGAAAYWLTNTGIDREVDPDEASGPNARLVRFEATADFGSDEARDLIEAGRQPDAVAALQIGGGAADDRAVAGEKQGRVFRGTIARLLCGTHRSDRAPGDDAPQSAWDGGRSCRGDREDEG